MLDVAVENEITKYITNIVLHDGKLAANIYSLVFLDPTNSMILHNFFLLMFFHINLYHYIIYTYFIFQYIHLNIGLLDAFRFLRDWSLITGRG